MWPIAARQHYNPARSQSRIPREVADKRQFSCGRCVKAAISSEGGRRRCPATASGAWAWPCTGHGRRGLAHGLHLRPPGIVARAGDSEAGGHFAQALDGLDPLRISGRHAPDGGGPSSQGAYG